VGSLGRVVVYIYLYTTHSSEFVSDLFVLNGFLLFCVFALSLRGRSGIRESQSSVVSNTFFLLLGHSWFPRTGFWYTEACYFWTHFHNLRWSFFSLKTFPFVALLDWTCSRLWAIIVESIIRFNETTIVASHKFCY